ncbi:MAG: hypothetical protein IJ438_03400 [Clostridia bacterium]|nr:hypothetical protein [Clostridia bacterium]
MDKKLHAEVRRLLLIGLVASLVTVIGGELPIGWTVYPVIRGDVTGMAGMLIGSGKLSVLQLACGVLFGGVGIALQYFGFEGAARLVGAHGNRKSARIMHWGAAATAGLGGIVHVICVALMFVCRVVDLSGVTGLANIPQPVLDFALWLVMPISVVFMPVYYAMCVALFAAVVRGRTSLPRWAAVLNPLTATLMINALPVVFPASPMVNALGMANMGIGSVLTFGGLLMLTGKEPPADQADGQR